MILLFIEVEEVLHMSIFLNLKILQIYILLLCGDTEIL